MYLESTDIYSDMDPRLQCAVHRQQRGLRTVATATSSADEIGVLALVSDPSEWSARSEVREGATLGQTERGVLVTARVPMARLESLRQAPEVVSLKAAQQLRPMLSATVPEINANPASLPPDLQATGGAGAVVGLVDFGGDFAHGNFRTEDGTTRLLAIWDQQGPERADSPFGYGRRYSQDEIDAALRAGDPYQSLGYGPPPDDPGPNAPRGTHGTHVMDIAAGNGRGSGVTGVAPEADLVFVEPATSDIIWSGEGVVGSEFGDSAQLLEALKFIFDEAADRPCAINVSLGTNGGPHDGSSLVEQGLDVLVSQKPNRAIVIAASNSFADGIHAAGTVAAGGSSELRWVIPDAVRDQSELEIWYSGDDSFGLELIAPGGTNLGSVPLGSNARAADDDGSTLLFVSHRASDPNNGDNVIGVFLEQRVPAGTWVIRLTGDQVTSGGFHAWIERNDASQASFEDADDNSHTLGSVSCGHKSVVVGSYDAHKPEKPLSFFSSAGPTRDGREKPEVSAPGHAVLAAHSRTGAGVTRKSGTSMAAPATTGMIALVLAEAAARGQSLDADTIRGLVTDSARRNPPAGGDWDPRYGHGRIDAAGALAALGAGSRSQEGAPASG